MFDIIGKRFWFLLIAGVVILISIISLATFGLKAGVEFSSGSILNVSFEQEVEQEQSAVINEQPTQQQPTQKSALSNEDKECMDECVQGGEIPMKCAEECGIELPQKN